MFSVEVLTRETHSSVFSAQPLFTTVSLDGLTKGVGIDGVGVCRLSPVVHWHVKVGGWGDEESSKGEGTSSEGGRKP